MNNPIFQNNEFDIETVQFIPGPDITNEEIATIALTLFQLTNQNSSNQVLSPWQIDSRSTYVAE